MSEKRAEESSDYSGEVIEREVGERAGEHSNHGKRSRHLANKCLYQSLF